MLTVHSKSIATLVALMAMFASVLAYAGIASAANFTNASVTLSNQNSTFLTNQVDLGDSSTDDIIVDSSSGITAGDVLWISSGSIGARVQVESVDSSVIKLADPISGSTGATFPINAQVTELSDAIMTINFKGASDTNNVQAMEFTLRGSGSAGSNASDRGTFSGAQLTSSDLALSNSGAVSDSKHIFRATGSTGVQMNTGFGYEFVIKDVTLPNPSGDGNSNGYQMDIKSYNSNDTFDETTLIDQVRTMYASLAVTVIQAFVDSIFEVEMDKTSLDLWTLDSNNVTTASQSVTVTTNASNGYSIAMWHAGLVNEAGDEITTPGSGSYDSDITAGGPMGDVSSTRGDNIAGQNGEGGGFGVAVTATTASGGFVQTNEQRTNILEDNFTDSGSTVNKQSSDKDVVLKSTDDDNTVIGIPGTDDGPDTVFRTNAATRGDTVDFEFRASINSLTEAGNYTDEIFYTVTPKF